MIFKILTLGVFGLAVWTLAWFLITAFFDAYYEVQNKPKEPMMWCWKHGMVRMGHALDLGYTKVCPLCYKDAMEQAEQGPLN